MARNKNPNGLYCEICGKPLVGQQRVHCSKQCEYITLQWTMSTRKRNLLRVENGKPVWEFFCKNCGKPFATKRGHEWYCEDCAKELGLRQFSKKEKYCKVCGKPLTNRMCSYCSDRCRDLQKSLNQCTDTKRTIKVIDGEPQLVTICRTCGKEFVVGSRTRYCSAECAKLANIRYEKERYARKAKGKILCQSYSIARY